METYVGPAAEQPFQSMRPVVVFDFGCLNVVAQTPHETIADQDFRISTVICRRNDLYGNGERNAFDLWEIPSKAGFPEDLDFTAVKLRNTYPLLLRWWQVVFS